MQVTTKLGLSFNLTARSEQTLCDFHDEVVDEANGKAVGIYSAWLHDMSARVIGIGGYSANSISSEDSFVVNGRTVYDCLSDEAKEMIGGKVLDFKGNYFDLAPP